MDGKFPETIQIGLVGRRRREEEKGGGPIKNRKVNSPLGHWKESVGVLPLPQNIKAWEACGAGGL